MRNTATSTRLPKVDLLRARCSRELRQQLDRIAAARQIDLSDVIREACRTHAVQFEQRLNAAA